MGSHVSHLNHSIDAIDHVITKVEIEFDMQHAIIKTIIADNKKQADNEIIASDTLLKNVKDSFRV